MNAENADVVSYGTNIEMQDLTRWSYKVLQTFPVKGIHSSFSRKVLWYLSGVGEGIQGDHPPICLALVTVLSIFSKCSFYDATLDTAKEKKLPVSNPNAKANCKISDMRSWAEVDAGGTNVGACTNAAVTNEPLVNAKANCTTIEYKSLGMCHRTNDGVVGLREVHSNSSGKKRKRSSEATTNFSGRFGIDARGNNG